jgi:type IV pilus assembly protein PilA
MLTSIKQRMDREDEGFTLIELMVVLLIIAILLAIAIPTFLGARNTANARSGQENLRNALTAEQSNWTSNQTFDVGLSTLEPSLTWGTATITTKGGNAVAVGLYNYANATTQPTAVTPPVSNTNTADGVVLWDYAKDGNCYAIYASDNATASFTSYAYYLPTTGTGAGCAAPSTLPTAAPTAGTQAASAAAAAAPVWSASF